MVLDFETHLSILWAYNLLKIFLYVRSVKKIYLREKGFEAKTTLPYLSILYKTFFKKEAEKSVFFY